MAFLSWLTGLCYAWTFRREDATGPHLFDDPRRGMLWCCRCGLERTELYPAPCAERPEQKDEAIGRYWCPECGARLLASFPHPLLCRVCIERLQGKGPADAALESHDDQEGRGALLWIGVALVLAVAWWLTRGR